MGFGDSIYGHNDPVLKEAAKILRLIHLVDYFLTNLDILVLRHLQSQTIVDIGRGILDFKFVFIKSNQLISDQLARAAVQHQQHHRGCAEGDGQSKDGHEVGESWILRCCCNSSSVESN